MILLDADEKGASYLQCDGSPVLLRLAFRAKYRAMKLAIMLKAGVIDH